MHTGHLFINCMKKSSLGSPYDSDKHCLNGCLPDSLSGWPLAWNSGKSQGNIFLMKMSRKSRENS